MIAKPRAHRYAVEIRWTGNRGSGTQSYSSYDRAHEVQSSAKPVIACSSDPAFRGDPEKYNPEELLVAAASSCHMLWYLHLCSAAGIVVTGYRDEALGTMTEEPGGGGRFTDIVLRPLVAISDPRRRDDALALHHRAHELCFVANSLNLPVRCEASVEDGSAMQTID